MKRLIFLFAFLAAVARAATGDVLSVAANASSWTSDTVFSGLNTGGTYDFGFGTNNDPVTGTPKAIFTAVSLGYDDTGTQTTVTRTIYGTKQVRKPYPNQTTVEETFSGGNTTVRFALSEPIYAKDIAGAGFVANTSSGTAPVVSLLSGLYTQSSTPTNASGASFAVTNNSTAAYPKVVANWAWPGFDRVTGDFKLRVVAFGVHGQQQRPVRVVKFTVTDTHSNTVTVYVTNPTYDSSVGDAMPVVEYVATIPVSTLTAGDVLTCNFVAYPWVGDSGSIVDSSTGSAQPNPLPSPITFVNDKSNTYGVTCALVDPTTGNDTTGTAYDAASFNEGTANKFLTIGKAAAAIAAYNNTNRSRNTTGAGVIYLRDGNYNWVGSSNTYGTTPNCWLTITRAAGSTSRSAVVINGQSGNNSAGNRVKLVDITYASNAAITMTGMTSVWFDNCTLNSTGTAPLYQNSIHYITRCTVPTWNMGLRPYSTENAPFALVRGCNLNSATYALVSYTVLGNGKTDTADGPAVSDYIGSSTAPAIKGHILAYNRITATRASGNLVSYGNNATITTEGMAIVQNVFEGTGSGGQALVYLAADGTTSECNNVIFVYNTVTGQRVNMGYNDTGTAAVNRLFWTVKNNLMEEDNIKSDTFTTANAARTGNWMLLYGVNTSGNWNAEITGLGAAGQYVKNFPGLRSYPNTTGGEPPGSASNSNTYYAFVNRLSYLGSGGATAGGGDYRLTALSPIIGKALISYLPIDLAGQPRSLTSDNPGAYAYVNAATQVPLWWLEL